METEEIDSLEVIRLRPHMFIGEVPVSSEQAYTCLAGLVCDFGERAAKQTADELTVTVRPDEVEVEYNAGIPHGTGSIPTLQVFMTSLRACLDAKSTEAGQELCCHSNLAVLTALSRHMSASTVHDGQRFSIRFEDGSFFESSIEATVAPEHTVLRFRPHPRWFGDLEFDIEPVTAQMEVLRHPPFSAKVEVIGPAQPR